MLIQNYGDLTNTNHDLSKNTINGHVVIISIDSVGSAKCLHMTNSTDIQTCKHISGANQLPNGFTISTHLINLMSVMSNLIRLAPMDLNMQVPNWRLLRIRLNVHSPCQAVLNNCTSAILTDYGIPFDGIPACKSELAPVIFVVPPHCITITTNVYYSRVQLLVKIHIVSNIQNLLILFRFGPRYHRRLTTNQISCLNGH